MSITDSFCSSEPSFSEGESLTSYFSEFESSSDEDDASENSFADYDSNDDEDFGHWENYEEGTYIGDDIPLFTESSGVSDLVNHLKSPIDFFKLFIDDEYLEIIKENTQEYYTANNNAQRTNISSHKKKWSKPNLHEIKGFLGLVLLMGIIKKPKIEDYWSSSILNGTPGFGNILSYDHFKQLSRNICFYNIRYGINSDDPLYKIRSLINKIVTTSQRLCKPDEYLTIDEGMIKFNGRSKLKVYMPLKPIKFGFKVYILADPRSGYVFNWVMHEGEDQSLIQIVSNLVENYKHKGHILCMDRFYSTIGVANEMTRQGFGFIGAIMRNRLHTTKLMTNVFKNLAKGESIFFCAKDMKTILTLWKDTKVVSILSNIGDDTISSVVRKDVDENNNFRRKEIECPDNVIIYARNSEGVDKFDQMISYYINDHKSIKWYWRIVLHLLFVALHNSFILYSNVNKVKPECPTFLSFQRSVIKSLVEEIREKKNIPQTPAKRNIKRTSTESIITSPQNDECALEYATQADCIICKPKGTRKRTIYSCKFHKKSLCVVPCYDIHRMNPNL